MTGLDGLPLPEVFPGHTATAIALLVAVYFGSFLIRGVVGVGNLALIIILGTLILGPHHAVVLAVTTTTVSQIQIVRPALRDGDWKIARAVVLAYFAAAAVGVWVFGRLAGDWLTLVFGISLGLVLAADMTRLLERFDRRFNFRQTRVLFPFSALSGLISGITGAGGLFFIALYVKQFAADPRTFRGTIYMLSILFVTWRVGLLAVNGFVTPSVLAEAALLFPLTWIGDWVGSRLFTGLSSRRFYQALQGVILISALMLVAKGMFDLAARDQASRSSAISITPSSAREPMSSAVNPSPARTSTVWAPSSGGARSTRGPSSA